MRRSHRFVHQNRPPWWPADEPWPPSGSARAEAWRRMRGRFFWRIGCLLALLFMLGFGGLLVLSWLLASALGVISIPRGALVFACPLGLLAFALTFGTLFFVGRALRRTARPIGDMIEAAGRVAEGDYTTRVAEHGPREVRALAQAFNSMSARLQASDEQRRSLLADVTHELRTPLTVIQGNLEGLLDGIYPPDRAHLEPIVEETRVLSRLIDDLRTLALTESGALKLQKETIEIGELISETVAAFRPQADTAGVAFSTDIAPSLPAIEVDPARIREVLENLLTNALRYTPQGGAVRITCFAPDAQHLTVSVADTGSGIAPDDLPHVFDRFYKSHESRGSGLGLAIAKNLIAAHGGEISVESEPEKGAMIRFTLPVKPHPLP
ncbi:MAG TPA: HAMP domain-containing sensor histidine kinase [Anaerolineae bacterium]|nr:HAMP domain-containing sensor histidine kinase [Anaerolineae bacterium]